MKNSVIYVLIHAVLSIYSHFLLINSYMCDFSIKVYSLEITFLDSVLLFSPGCP
jgi:hypothetical protein